MMQMIKAKPVAPDLRVWREDGSGYVAPDGETMPLTAYVRRRLNDGDLVEVPEPKKEKGE